MVLQEEERAFMNGSFVYLKRKVDAYRARQFLRTYADRTLASLIYGLCLAAFFISLESIFRFPAGYLKTAVIAAAGFYAALFIWQVWNLRGSTPLSIRSLNEDLEKEYRPLEDRLINAFSLYGRRNILGNRLSEFMVDGLVDETLRITKDMPAGVLSLKMFYRNLAAFVIMCGLMYTLAFTGRGPLRDSLVRVVKAVSEKQVFYMEIWPGDTGIPAGSSLMVKVRTNISGYPLLEMDRLDQRYRETASVTRDDMFEFSVNNIKEAFRYRVLDKKGRPKSGWFSVEIVRPPAVEGIAVTYHYPSYTGFAVKVSSVPQIKALRGTTVDISAAASSGFAKAVLVTDNSAAPMKKAPDNSASAGIVLEDQTYYRVELEDEGGRRDEGAPSYPISVLDDGPPAVTVRSPQERLRVSPEAKVEISGEVSDDIGLGRIYLTYYIDMAGATKTVHIKDSSGRKKDGFSFVWDISATDAASGNIITYYVNADDNNTLFGPGTGRSQMMQLEITGFREKHKDLLEEAGKLEEMILDALSESYDLTAVLEQPDFGTAPEKLDKVQDKLESLEEFMEKLIDRMKEDPYIEKNTIDEYSAMKGIVGDITGKDIPKIEDSIKKQEKGALEQSRQMSDELERLLRLAEDSAKRERMDDILSSASDSLEKARDLADLLNSEDITPQDIYKKMEKLGELLMEMSKALRDFPQDLPDEFINSESLKDMDIEKARQQALDFQKALAAGDLDAARKYLDDMIKSLQDVLGSLQEAASGIHSERRNSLVDRTGQLRKALESVISRQEDIIDDTSEVEDRARINRNDYNKERFVELKGEYNVLKSSVGYSYKFRDIDREFADGYLYRAGEMLEKIEQEIKPEWKQRAVRRYISRLGEQSPEERFVGAQGREYMVEISTRQSDVRQDTEKIREGLRSLSHMTARIGSGMTGNLDLAARYMGYAVAQLDTVQPSQALASERQALAYLSESSRQMETLAAQLEEIPQGLGEGKLTRGYQTVPSMGGSGGRSGYREGYVEIPGPQKEER
ncbi:MAG: DUF4175 family protein, partial [Elusimicrobia bacterium]|nr:DUF4175 family protein [Elusimicrobiota bacterium]